MEIVRIKRWTSKADRERHADWHNPTHLDFQELADLNDLYAEGSSGLRNENFIDADNAGTVMLAAYDKAGLASGEDDERGTIDRIVGFLSLTVAVLPDKIVGYVNEVLVKPEYGDEVRSRLLDAIKPIADELGVNDVRMPASPPARLRRSGISEIDAVERFDRVVLPDEEPTSRGSSRPAPAHRRS